MTQYRLNLLLVEDDRLAARSLATDLERPGRIVAEVVGSAEEVLARLARGGVDAIITDLAMAGMDGIELTGRVRALDPALPVVVLTADTSIERAVDAIRAGANHVLRKPANVAALRALIERAVAERPVREEVAARVEQRTTAGIESYIRGAHPRLDAVRAFAEQVAQVPDARVLITGETGTGKSRLARAIHDISGAPGRFVEVNCAALPPSLLESELFGHEKGAFTDARKLKRGLAEMADRGTLFLDEIGALPLDLQAKLLLFIERREIRRVGGTDPIPLRCRLIAATHENLRQRVRERTFRQDLLFRLDVASAEMPPLREMPSVIPEMARGFVDELCDELGRPLPELSDASFALLIDHDWPGNMREVRNAVERALIFHRQGPLIVYPPPASDGGADPASGVLIPWGVDLDELERRYLDAVLRRHGDGELNELAAQLGISRKTLWEKRKRYQL